MVRNILILFGLLLCSFASPLTAQPYSLQGKSVGVYISSKDFEFTELLNMQVTQFLTIGEDRSYAGRLKPELMIRLGWLWTEQLPALAEADTVHFLNADPPRGYAFREGYDPLTNQFGGTVPEALQDVDVVLVLNFFEMKLRAHKSTFVRSNRMIIEKINVKTTSLEITPFLIGEQKRLAPVRVCFDEQKDKNPPVHFDFYQEQSPMGKYLGRLFSNWWEQWQNSGESNCPEE